MTEELRQRGFSRMFPKPLAMGISQALSTTPRQKRFKALERFNTQVDKFLEKNDTRADG